MKNAEASEPADSDWRGQLDPLLLEAASDVDRTLLRWSLDLTVRERLRFASRANSAFLRYRREAAEAS